MRVELTLGLEGREDTIAQQFARLEVQSPTRIDVAKEIARQEVFHVLPQPAGHACHHRRDAAGIQFILDSRPLLVPVGLRNRPGLLQRQGNTPLLENFVHRSHGIQHPGKTDERCRQIHGFPKFERGNADVQGSSGMRRQLRERLERGQRNASNQFALLHRQFARAEDLAEDEFLEDVHHFRVGALAGQGFTAEKGMIVLLADLHAVCCPFLRCPASILCLQGEETG